MQRHHQFYSAPLSIIFQRNVNKSPVQLRAGRELSMRRSSRHRPSPGVEEEEEEGGTAVADTQ